MHSKEWEEDAHVYRAEEGLWYRQASCLQLFFLSRLGMIQTQLNTAAEQADKFCCS